MNAQFVFKVHIPYLTSIHISRQRRFSDVAVPFFLCWPEPTDVLIPKLHNVTELFGDAVRYPVSDMAHFVASVFQITHEAVSEYASQIYSLSIHGHNRPECEDIFISSGLSGGSKQMLFDLKFNLNNTGLTVAVAGDSSSHCPLVGSTNVQGRFINGSAQPCTVPGVTPTGYFIHIEQSRLVRDNSSEYSKLIEAIRLTINEK